MNFILYEHYKIYVNRFSNKIKNNKLMQAQNNNFRKHKYFEIIETVDTIINFGTKLHEVIQLLTTSDLLFTAN